MQTLSIILIVLSSFFIYAPQALAGIAASNQATMRTASSANGVLGIFGYASTAVSGAIFGLIADKLGWDAVFMVSICFGILGVIVTAIDVECSSRWLCKSRKSIK